MNDRRILISGAGIAGPSLALWLARFGFAPTVVERARALRDGGQAIDFRGEAHLTALRRMGLLDTVTQARTRAGPLQFVDARGRVVATVSSELMSGDVEIRRGDLVRILHEATCHDVEYVFGDRVVGLEQDGRGVTVAFGARPPERFGAVIGADGLHSGVRALAFGPESSFVRHLGYYAATFTMPNALGIGPAGQVYSMPGRAVGLLRDGAADRARALFYFASPVLPGIDDDPGEQRRLLARTFAGAGWRVPQVLEGLRQARHFYFDAIGEVRMPRWSDRRVALIGDAAARGTIGGMGAGLAVVTAYLLAYEIARCDGDYAAAFVRYEGRCRAYARNCQRSAGGLGPFMAPASSWRIWLRDRMLRAAARLPGRGLVERVAMARASSIELPELQDAA